MPKVRDFLETKNVAELLDDDQLREISSKVIQGFRTDENSRENWMDLCEEWLKVAMQVKEDKNFPWPGASNVKYPLVTTAAIQFHARAYPTLIPPKRLVKGIVIGKDPDEEKKNRAIRIGKHMSWQLLRKSRTWEQEMDKCLLVVPILGCVFKKTYYDPIRKENQSDMVFPKDVVVNYWASDLASAERVTHILAMNSNEVHSYIKAELYLDEDLRDPSDMTAKENLEKQAAELTNPPTGFDESTPYTMLEQHTWLDLDDDGYKEPYIVTVNLDSGKLLRIVPRYDEETVFVDDNNDVIYIDPIEYWTKFSFIPNPDGGFYDLGFGHILGPLNETSNTLINQLIDAGTLSNTQGGFIGRGLRLKEGTLRFKPNEWKVVNSTGSKIADNVFPMPVRDPSNVLFQLLGMIIDAGQRLAATTDIFVGETPGQNTPATTTMAAIEEGSKVFTAIYKRLFISLNAELKKIFLLNHKFLDEEEYFTVLDEEDGDTIGQEDYDPTNFDVLPTADPALSSQSMKLAKAQGLMELLQMGTVNPGEVTRRILEAQEHENIEQLMEMPPPQPDPEIELKKQELQQEAEFKQQEIELEYFKERIKVLMEVDKVEAQRALNEAKAYSERAKAASQLKNSMETTNGARNQG